MYLQGIVNELCSFWKEVIRKLNADITDTLLEQSLYQEIFELYLKEHFDTVESSIDTDPDPDDVTLQMNQT